MNKYLILTVTAGEGHNAIARALNNELSANEENKIVQVDLFKRFATISKVKLIDSGYIWVCKTMPAIYNMFFRAFQKRKPEKRDTSIVQNIIKKETAKVLSLINEEDPDVIICTHFFPAIILTNLRKEFNIRAKVICVLSDYTVTPFFECAIGIDYLITPDKSLHPLLIEKGYHEEQLLDYGIPVKTEFSETIEKNEIRKELNLDPDMFTVMVMFGGGGFGAPEKVVRKLLKLNTPIQIMIVNGRDEATKKRIDKIISKKNKIHKIQNWGYCTTVNKLMSASDLLLGKPGGISINESMNSKLPTAFSKNQVAQEYDNFVFLSRNNACIQLTRKYDIVDAIEDLLCNKSKIDEIKQNIEKISKPNATKQVAQLCDSLIDKTA